MSVKHAAAFQVAMLSSQRNSVSTSLKKLSTSLAHFSLFLRSDLVELTTFCLV